MRKPNNEKLPVMTQNIPSIGMKYAPPQYDNSFFINGLSKFSSTLNGVS